VFASLIASEISKPAFSPVGGAYAPDVTRREYEKATGPNMSPIMVSKMSLPGPVFSYKTCASAIGSMKPTTTALL
jgi:hypothetical protein